MLIKEKDSIFSPLFWSPFLSLLIRWVIKEWMCPLITCVAVCETLSCCNLHGKCWFVYPVSSLWCVRETKLLLVVVHFVTLVQHSSTGLEVCDAQPQACGSSGHFSPTAHRRPEPQDAHISPLHTWCSKLNWWRLKQCFQHVLPFGTCRLITCSMTDWWMRRTSSLDNWMAECWV